MDWRKTLAFDRHVEGCSAILHLGAALPDTAAKQRLNVDATDELAAAAERAGVKYFCFFSSVSAYGSPTTRVVTEDAALVTPDRDVAGECWAEPSMRAYARSKAAAERRIAERARNTHYVVFRPTIVRRASDIRALGDWSWKRRVVFGGVSTHTIAVEDVSGAALWFMERTLGAPDRLSGVETYTLADDEGAGPYAAFFREAFALTGNARYRCPVHAPAMIDRALNWYRYRTLDPRWPMGLVRFRTDRLMATGYRHALGANAAYRRAVLGDPAD